MLLDMSIGVKALCPLLVYITGVISKFRLAFPSQLSYSFWVIMVLFIDKNKGYNDGLLAHLARAPH